jgi:predicted short-subunit dehydrogenase-like oxidoreductase (DUF2520 family)
MSKKLKIAVAGIGNLGWNLALQLHDRGYTVRQIITRKTNRRQKFAKRIDAEIDESIADLQPKIDLLFVCIPDDQLKPFIQSIKRDDVAIVHCSGFTGLIENENNPVGVFYPFQTFTKYFSVEWNDIPIFIEGSEKELRKTLRKIAEDLSQNVMEVSFEQRKMLHIAGVFGANFTNHLIYLIKGILDSQKLPLDVMKPLLDETIRKAFDHGPAGAQTGPAKRQDKKVIEQHLKQLETEKTLREFYDLFTRNIQKEYNS